MLSRSRSTDPDIRHNRFVPEVHKTGLCRYFCFFKSHQIENRQAKPWLRFWIGNTQERRTEEGGWVELSEQKYSLREASASLQRWQLILLVHLFAFHSKERWGLSLLPTETVYPVSPAGWQAEFATCQPSSNRLCTKYESQFRNSNNNNQQGEFQTINNRILFLCF